MPLNNKYDSVIKPNFDRIRELKMSGATDRDIYRLLKVSSAVWFKNKKEHKEFRDILNIKETIKKDLVEAQEILNNLPTEEMFLKKIAGISFDDENAPLDVVLKGLRQIHPEANHYLQLEREKVKIEREKMEADKNNIVKSQTTTIGSDVVDMITNAINPDNFKE